MHICLYCSSKKQADKDVRNSKYNFKKKLAQNIKRDTTSFYAYARKSSKIKTKVGPLVDNNGVLMSFAPKMCEELNSYFASVFTHEDTTSVPAGTAMIQEPPSEALQDITITEEIVEKKLSELKRGQGCGSRQHITTISTSVVRSNLCSAH